MKHPIDVRNENDCAKVGDLVSQALRIGFDVTVTTARPDRLSGVDLRQVIVEIIEPPELAAAVAERRASEAQNRARLERTYAALRSVGDPDPAMTVAFVGEDDAFAQAQAAHLADGLAAVDNSMSAAYDRAEGRIGWPS